MKLIVGNEYVTRNGSHVKLIGAANAMHAGAASDSEVIYFAELQGENQCKVDYYSNGKAVSAVTDDLEIVGELYTGDTAPQRDDDPVHPQDDPEPAPPQDRWTLDTEVGVGSQTRPPDIVREHPRAAPQTDTADEPLNRHINEMLQAVLDSKPVQWRRAGNTEWEDLRSRSFAIRMLTQPGAHGNEFRIKPSALARFVPIYRNGKAGQGYDQFSDTPDVGWGVVNVLKIWVDPITSMVVAMENIKPRPAPSAMGAK